MAGLYIEPVSNITKHFCITCSAWLKLVICFCSSGYVPAGIATYQMELIGQYHLAEAYPAHIQVVSTSMLV